jgi:hypothetical protein
MSIRKIVTPIMMLLFITAGTVAVSAQWKKLGTREVNDRVDHDTINVTFLRGDFRRIKLTVSKAPVRFYRVTVTFGNGTTQEIELRSLIGAGGETRAIDLNGTDRVIRKVDFWYEAASLGRKKARITLYGRG